MARLARWLIELQERMEGASDLVTLLIGIVATIVAVAGDLFFIFASPWSQSPLLTFVAWLVLPLLFGMAVCLALGAIWALLQLALRLAAVGLELLPGVRCWLLAAQAFVRKAGFEERARVAIETIALVFLPPWDAEPFAIELAEHVAFDVADASFWERLRLWSLLLPISISCARRERAAVIRRLLRQ